MIRPTFCVMIASEEDGDDHQERGGMRWQAHGHRATRPATVTGKGRWPGSGAPAHPPHHVLVHWLPGHQDHRGEDDSQRPHGQGDSRLGGRPFMPHPACEARKYDSVADLRFSVATRSDEAGPIQ
jgi:hypothetical protein